ncbi:hypothetical protein ACFTXJ_13270 [Streptomyces zhihengii]|uniref:hypothetical protein n=1 Tax=Streptomyces zhihengii TaxID=1818004 RepID=UPI00362790AB
MALAKISPPQRPILDAYTAHGVQVLILYGDADHAHRHTLETAFTAAWDTGRRLAIDLTQLTYADETMACSWLPGSAPGSSSPAPLPPVLRQRIAITDTQRFLPTAPKRRWRRGTGSARARVRPGGACGGGPLRCRKSCGAGPGAGPMLNRDLGRTAP